MPPGPLVKSPRLGSLLVTLFLLGVLACSLGAAYLLTRARSIRWQQLDLGEIRLSVPALWTLAPPPAAQGVIPLATFVAGDAPDHRLSIAQLEETAFRAPIVALHEAVRAVAGSNAASAIEQADLQRRRSGDFIIVHTTAQRLDAPYWMLIAVATRDGRHYWALDMAGSFDEGGSDAQPGLTAHQNLFGQVCASITPLHTAAPSDREFQAAELSTASRAWRCPDDFTPLASREKLPGMPLTLLPRASDPYLAVIRLRATIDPDVDDPDDPLFPARLLEREHLSLTGQETPPLPIERAQIVGRSVWEMATESRISPQSQTNFVRLVSFVRLGAGRALLVETFCEPQLLGQTRRWLADLIRSAPRPVNIPSPFADPASASPIAQAIARGERLAARQRALQLDTVRQSTYYDLIHDRERAVAYAIGLAVSGAANDPWAVHGRSVTTRPEGQTLLFENRQWKLGPAGDRFFQQVNIQRQHVTLPVAQNLHAYRHELDHNRLVLYQSVDSTRAGVRPIQLPAGCILPQALRAWDIATLRSWKDREGLLWILSGEYPVACSVRWIELAPASSSQSSSQGQGDEPGRPAPGSFLLIRPLVHPEPDVYRLSPTGQVIERWEVRRPTGRLRYVRGVDRLTLLAAFPDAVIPLPANP